MDSYKKLDNELQQVEIGDGSNFTYVSFKKSIADTRIGSLHINNINNIEVKYEYI